MTATATATDEVDDRTAWQRRSWKSRAILVAVVGVFGLAVLAEVVGISTEDDTASGERSSSTSNSGDGLAAFAELAVRYGHNVERIRGRIDADLDPRTTLFAIDVDLRDQDEIEAVITFVERGGRLVIGGSDPFDIDRLDPGAPTWRAGGNGTYQARRPRDLGARTVVSGGSGVWADPGTTNVAFGEDDAALLTLRDAGAGTILYLSDSTPLANRWIDQRDNAAFALELIGTTERTAIFLEGVRRTGAESGWAAIPTRWKTALWLAVLAALILVWAVGTRFGPPERPTRSLGPARGEYVDALASVLARTGEIGPAGDALFRDTRRLVLRRAAVGGSVDDNAVVERAARTLGLDDVDRGLLLQPPDIANSAIALTLLHARLTRGESNFQTSATETKTITAETRGSP